VGTTGAKVTKVNVWAQQPFAGSAGLEQNTENTYVVLFGLPASNDTTTGICVAQQSTPISPSSVPQWIHVGHWSSKTTLKDSNVDLLPESDGQVIAAVSLLDAQSLEPSADKVVYKIVYETLETLPVITTNQVAVTSTSSTGAWTGAVSGTLVATNVLAELEGVTTSL
jgi:hypothetical protein